MPSTDEFLKHLISNSRSYAGIGSRLTPAYGLSLIEGIAAMLGNKGLILRSGGAHGADTAFEWGCHQTNGKKEIFLPWKGFNGNRFPLLKPSKDAEKLASLCHPNWAACEGIARKFHARNSHQILGLNLDDPVDFVLFWAQERDGIVKGGIATAIYPARQQGIPTFNLRVPEVFDQWSRLAGEYILLSHPIENHPFSFLSRIMRDPPAL